MKTLFVTSEAYPFAVSGGLGDYSHALPKALRRRFVGCRVIMPLYSEIGEKYRHEMSFIGNLSVPVSWRQQYCGVFELKNDGVIYYFLDNEYYFKRPGMYGFYDDAERYAFFARAVLEILPLINFFPDVIHCNDWQSALVPVYKNLYYSNDSRYSQIKTLFTIHNIQYQGKYGLDILEDVFGISYEQKNLVEYDGCINLLKGGIEAADRVCTVSRTYAEELKDPWFSYGLDSIIRARSDKITGIVNGIDYDIYNPQTDPMIFKNYSFETISDKYENKAELQRMLGLNVSPDKPVIGMVTRLVGHKGLDLVKYAFDKILSNDLQFVILGSGDEQFEVFFGEMASRYPGRFALRTGFVPELAHKIYAGADIFLMPSKNEPCGLAQMIALRYGTVPVVRETGGLKDTVLDADSGGVGYTFKSYNADDMYGALNRAVGGFYDKDFWQGLVKKDMQCDNSWNASAGEYIALYRQMTSKR